MIELLSNKLEAAHPTMSATNRFEAIKPSAIETPSAERPVALPRVAGYTSPNPSRSAARVDIANASLPDPASDSA